MKLVVVHITCTLSTSLAPTSNITCSYKRNSQDFNHTQDHHTTMSDMVHTCCAMQFLLPLEPREAAGGSISVYGCHKVGKV